MPGFALDTFEAQAEAFMRARAWREHQFLSRNRPGRGLNSLYLEDFPDFTSTDFWADLQAASFEDQRQQTRLSALLASANLEGRTLAFATAATRVEATATVTFEGDEIPWYEAPARWSRLADVPRRHALEEAWRGVLRSELTPQLERWHEALRAQLPPLGGDNWLAFWSGLGVVDAATVGNVAKSVLEQTAEVYGNALGVFLGQLELPIDDVWNSDVDRAFRAPRFDATFPERLRMPTVIRTMRDLGVELEEQSNLHLEYGTEPGVTVLPLEIPAEVRVLLRLEGGWLDYARMLRGLGIAEHAAHTDGSLRMWERWLGDQSPTQGYGALLESLVRDPTWLALRMDYSTSEDFRVITHLEWLYRVRKLAAMALYEQRVWQLEPGGSLAAEFEEALSGATRVRHFTDQYLQLLLESPWSTLRSAVLLRAEAFAAQLRAFLKREFDEEWWRSGRAVHFIKDELWRPGRRHTAEELLGFMGYEGFDPAVLTAEFLEVLQPL